MASKFWGRGSDSEDESEEEVTSSSEEESSSDDDSDSSSSSGSSSSGSSSDSDDSDKPKKGGASRFLMGSSESESEDERRVVKSAKDKAQDELTSVCNEIRNKMHINDWAAIQTLFDKLNKQLEKTQKITQTLGTPRVYVKLLVELEDFLSKTLQEKPKLSPTNTRALTRMKQTLRKHNAAYAEQMAAFRANPVSESEASEASESEEGSDESDSEDGEGGEGSDDGEGKFKTVRTGVVARPKDKILSMDPKEITYEMVQKKLREVALARGKTSSLDRAEHVEMLTYLASVAKGPVQRLEVLIHIITVTFDMNQPMHAAMTVPNWNRCAATLFDTLSLMAANPHIVLVDQPPEEEGERGAEPPVGEPVHVWGNLASFLERLDDEWTSSLKNLDPHANEYMDRLKDETILLALAQKVSDYLSATGQHDKLAAVALKRIEHFYYKTAVVYGAMRKLAAIQQAESAAAAAAAAAAPAEDGAEAADGVEGAGAGLPAVRVVLPADFSLPESCGTLLEELSRVVYAHGNDNQKGQAMLCGVYFRCIHDDFYGARDMLLMSRIQEQTQQLENRMQVLFNRTMAQLGLCAFRAGLVPEAHQCLDTLYGTGRVKELLAQGIQQHRFQEKTAEQEAAERRRQVPFHMHINLELLETVYLTAAMLLEVPNIAALGPLESRKRIISKPLRRLMENYERQTFVGPPESVRDHMMAACRSLATGDWRRCYGYVTALTCWQLVPQREQVLGMLRAKVQAEGLRTYLLAYSKYYSSLSMAQLCDMFELPERQVHALVSRLMAEEQLPGSHDQPTGTIVMQNVEPSRVQVLAGQFADKAALLVDLNERALALRTGGVNQEDEEGEGRRGPQDMQGGRRTRMGGRGPFTPGASGRGDRGGRGGGRGGGGGGGGGRGVRFGADRLGLGRVEEGYSGGVFGRGRARQQRDDNNLHRLGSYGGRAGRV